MFVLPFRAQTGAHWSTEHTGIRWSFIKCTARSAQQDSYTTPEYLADVYDHWLKFLFLHSLRVSPDILPITCGIKNYLVTTPRCPFKLSSIAVVFPSCTNMQNWLYRQNSCCCFLSPNAFSLDRSCPVSQKNHLKCHIIACNIILCSPTFQTQDLTLKGYTNHFFQSWE